VVGTGTGTDRLSQRSIVEDVDDEVERRIAERLAPLARVRRCPDGREMAPPPYVRRHGIEHAAAGGMLPVELAAEEFLPYVDAARYHTAGVKVSRSGGGLGIRRRLAFSLQVW
jgi:hypothetical protein